MGLYIAYSLAIKPPDITSSDPDPAQPQPVISQDDPSPSASSVQDSTPAGPQRREGVYNFVLLGKDKESGNTDSIIVVSYDTVEQKVGMISIPRDTVVQRTWSKNPKINFAYVSKGPDMVKQEIENTFGIPIDFYIYVNLDGFIALVNKLDGVDVYIPIDMNYDDPIQDLHIHYTKGQYHLNGQQAMEVVRFRHNNESDGGGGYDDEGRAEMQRQVLVALAKKVLSWNSLTKIQSFWEIFQTYVKTDLSTSDMIYFATQALQFDISTGLTQSALEGRGDGNYKGYPWCYVFEAETILPTLNATVNPYDTDLTADDLNLPKAESYYFNY